MNVNVEFTGTWLTNLTTGQTIQLQKQTRERAHTTTGQVASYAGRNVIESTTVTTASSTLVFVLVDQGGADLLESWETVPMLLRDSMGWYRTGTFFGISAALASPAFPPEYQVTVTWVDSDYPLGV